MLRLTGDDIVPFASGLRRCAPSAAETSQFCSSAASQTCATARRPTSRATRPASSRPRRCVDARQRQDDLTESRALIQTILGSEQGLRTAEQLGIRAYYECSSLQNIGVDDVFEAATRVSMLVPDDPSKAAGAPGSGGGGASRRGGESQAAAARRARDKKDSSGGGCCVIL